MKLVAAPDVEETSPKQVAANRRNARLSTGPKTPAGLQRVAANFGTLKYGLTSSAVVVPGLERSEDWEEHRAAVNASVAPQNALEAMLADRAALALWRLNRCARAERRTLQLKQAPIEERVAARIATNIDELRWNLKCQRNAVSVVEDYLAGRGDDEDEVSNNAIPIVEAMGAQVVGIAMVTVPTYDEKGVQDGSYDELPEGLEYTEAGEDDFSVRRHVRRLFEVLAAAAKAPCYVQIPTTPEEVAEETLAPLRGKADRLAEDLAQIEATITGERDGKAVPSFDSDHITRYEVGAERALTRALASLAAVRQMALDRKDAPPGETVEESVEQTTRVARRRSTKSA